MKLLTVAMILLSFNVLADDKEDGKPFEERKAHALQRVEERISKLNEHNACISAAADKEALKGCHQKMKAHRQEMKNKWKSMKAERKGKK